MNRTTVLLALLAGFVTGGVFRFVDVPIPAPPTLSGVMGIFGVYLGYKVVSVVLTMLAS